MSWFKIDDGMHSHPKTLAAGNEAIGLWARCGSYCSQHLTEGRVPRAVALMYGDMHLIDTLVKVGLFEPLEDDWLIHDYHDYNPTREKVLSEREAAAARQRAAREKARLAREAKAAKEAADAKRHADSHAVTSSVTNAVTHADSHTEGDAQHGDRHAVTYAATPPRSEMVTVMVDPAPDEASGVAPVQDIADAPSRRDSRQQSRAPRPDPTRPVLPTEVRGKKKPRAADPADAPDALFECAPPARGEEPVEPVLNSATLIAEWVDYRTRNGEENKPTEEMIKRVGKELKKLLAEVAYDVVRQGFQEWDAKPGSPTAIPSFVNQVQSRRARGNAAIPAQRPSATTQRTQTGLSLMQEFAAEEGVDISTLLPSNVIPIRRELTA